MRLDLYMVSSGLAKSRGRAKEYILNGQVFSNGIMCRKPSENVTGDIELRGETLKYVGRGGLKLEKALLQFRIKLKDKICLDIGASTGGFTDCMLQNGAELVYAVDVGHGQLDDKLINDSRVINMEGTNITALNADSLGKRPDFISADVSFVSLKHILPKISELLVQGGEAVILIKPQFEAGKTFIGKNGVVKDAKVHIRVIKEIIAFCISVGLEATELDYSPICGGNGNIEYLAHIVRIGEKASETDAEKTVKAAFAALR